ncbi:hypothetical protein EAE99_012329 [Botrytis elliptica]|nr:hypothetical protein EAE99_012329 [Botrytis elliptica]
MAQECSATSLCATGCCSEFGFCGTGDDHCGKDCLSTCDYKLGCDVNNPCPSGKGCCSKFGFCGLGPNYCAPEVCVANCDRKSECDPGYGAFGYSEIEKCPLNVCCSKWGFCGLTEEFCGNKTITRPSCSSSGSTTRRTVGYYEGWANRKVCQPFPPDMIPLGTYTHINFAFASIDPITFSIVPGDPSDVELYEQVTMHKLLQPDLQVFIVIGGWTFNDAGLTATTFSDLAASLENQKKFFTSLTSFMSTYNFDGVEIDWEYPVADDRNGRPADFHNFPSFIANLKSHLTPMGRGGVSITLPASYWYLQYFDLEKLQKSVDFFNIMTYDMHGLWDKKSKWAGNFLNAHTNLTEITTALDLLWRNHINPSKVNLGLAFYARSFAMLDPTCSAPGCRFSSGGNAGRCTNSIGTLSNAEIADRIKENGLTPIHYVDAAVKIITWDDQWVAYDDAETYQQKLDFARSQCLGGIMVWALSQDSADLNSSKAIFIATNSSSRTSYSLKSVASTAEDADQPSTTLITNVPYRQCRWSDCGSGCESLGDNFLPIKRAIGEGDGKFGHPEGEDIQDSSYCGSASLLRKFCCPTELSMPTCAHFFFNNGKCNADNTNSCTDMDKGYVEVGSINSFCNTRKKGGYEQICCTTDTPSMKLYSQSIWNGKPGQCDTKSRGPLDFNGCPTDNYNVRVADSIKGSGGTYCGLEPVPFRLQDAPLIYQSRVYCSNTGTGNGSWGECNVYKNHGPTPPGRSRGWCQSGCPIGQIRVAMEDPSPCQDNGGAIVTCCEGDYSYEKSQVVVSELLKKYQDAAKDFVESYQEECSAFLASNANGDGLNLGSSAFNLDSRSKKGFSSVETMVLLLYTLLNDPIDGNTMLRAERELWELTMQSLGLQNLGLTPLRNFLLADRGFRRISKLLQAEQVPCNAEKINDVIGAASNNGSGLLTEECAIFTIPCLDSDFFYTDPNSKYDYVASQASGNPIDSCEPSRKNPNFSGNDETLHQLGKRDGAPREYSINLGTDVRGNPRIIFIWSFSYPSGQNGQTFVEITRNVDRYSLNNPEDCTDASYAPTADPEDTPAWVVEHIFELQTPSRLLEFMVHGILPQVVTGGVTVPEYRTQRTLMDPDILEKYFQKPYQTWDRVTEGLKGRPDANLMHCLGAKDNTKNIRLMDAAGNAIKSRLWSLKSPIADATWEEKGYDIATQKNGNAALSAIRDVLAVMSYFRQPAIDKSIRSIVTDMHDAFLEFQDALNTSLAPQYLEIVTLWDEGVQQWAMRMNQFTRDWLRIKISKLRSLWESFTITSSPTDPLRAYARRMLRTLNELELQVDLPTAQVDLTAFAP